MDRVVVLHNADFDAGVPDASSVAGVAAAVAGALRETGHRVETIALHGTEVFDVLPRLEGALVFNLCESMAGDPRNEPTFVGLLDLFRIPYTGSDLLALASCLYKHRTKEILVARGVSTPSYRVFDRAALDDVGGVAYPLFLKLLHEDASIGITEENVVRDAVALRRRATAMIEEYRQPVLAEGYIEGRELNVTLVGSGADLRVMPLYEIDFAAMPADRPRIVSYAAKWDENHVDYVGTKPVPLRDATPALVAAVEDTARRAYTALGLRDYGRVDLRVDTGGTPWVIDINPNPDLSPDAGVARSAKAGGLSYSELINTIAQLALRRARS